MARRKPAQTLSAVLRKRIAQDGRSLAELAREAGIERTSLWRFVRRKGGIALKTADRLAAILRLRLADDEERRP
jgi:DNA-binding phage protein